MNSNDRTTLPWLNKISHHSQLGGIETSVLDNGLGRGARIAWINTGTGLRYKIVLDRAMDIVDAFYNEHSLAWLSHSSVTPPQPFSDRGKDWLKTFSGGLVTTCGLDHAGVPDKFGNDTRGLHGPVSNIPAEIIAVRQPDPVNGDLEMSITGKIVQTQVFGPTLELIRTISGTIGQPYLRIHDAVTNRGNTVSTHMLLYHINFGWPLADEGAEIFFEGSWKARYDGKENKIFTNGNDFKKCPPPLDDHSGYGEEALFIDPIANEKGVCLCGISNKKLGIKASVTFNKEQLPYLTNWQHWGKGEYVTGLEPANCLPVGRVESDKQGILPYLQPGEKREYEVKIELSKFHHH
ncbi:MAG: aldose 1-epimerase family protein [Chitinophagaceae bacterium]|nr:aldose 1-epimerase family protein [Chitinophagaceae bacterium]